MAPQQYKSSPARGNHSVISSFTQRKGNESDKNPAKLTQPPVPFVKLISCQLIRPPIHPFQSSPTSFIRVVEIESSTSVSNIDLDREPGTIRWVRHVHSPREDVAEIELLVCAVQETI